MTRHLDPDRTLEDWLAEGPSQLPDQAVHHIVRLLDETEQRKPTWLSGSTLMSRIYLSLGAAVVGVAVLAGALYLTQQESGSNAPTPSVGPSTASLSPSEPPASASVHEPILEYWTGIVRSEPPGGAGDVSVELDSDSRWILQDADLGRVPDWVDIERLSIPSYSTCCSTGGIGLLVDFDPVAVRASKQTAYGVVIDTDADGVGDLAVGMDNDPPGAGPHREWIVNLETGETSLNTSGVYGHREWGAFTDTYFGRHMIVGLGAPAESLRFYFWAATVEDRMTVVDYVPNSGWLNLDP